MSEETPAAAKRGNAPKDWPNTIAAAAATQLNRKQLERMRQRGALVSEKDSAGVTRWNPDMLALVAQARDDADDDDDDLPPQATSGTLNGQALVLLKQAQQHTESAFKLVLEPMRDLTAERAEDVKALRARVKELEAKLDESLALREKLLSELHVRELLTAEAAQGAARKDRALKLVEQHAPKLLAAINPAASAVVDLMRSLSAEQRGIMLETDFLTPEQKKQVITVLESAPAPDAPPPAPTEEPAPEQKDEPAA